MDRTLVCLTLSKSTIRENLNLINKYRKYVDIVELRADYLNEDELLAIRRFPELAQIPAILTIRRKNDGGLYGGGEAARTMLFARALAFADPDKRKNFAYVDFEVDYHIPSLEDAALAYGTLIIRSFHDMNNPVRNLPVKFREMCKSHYEIPKIACMPHNLSDVTNIFKECENLTDLPHIICAMGPMGIPTRILAHKLHSYLSFVSPSDSGSFSEVLGHIDPITMNDVYNFRNLNKDTQIFGITGWPLKKTASPALHNKGYHNQNINAVYIPVCSPDIKDTLDFADQIGMKGISVTIPHKASVLPFLNVESQQVQKIGACNTIVKQDDKTWSGYNTDTDGLYAALKEFLRTDSLKGWKVAIIGAGGAAKAAAYVVKKLGGKGCVFNRTLSKAKSIAEKFGFEYALLSPESTRKLEKYSSLIIQTTSVGMGSTDVPNETNNPIWFYDFNGKEKVFDIVYIPELTPIMAQAEAAGCEVCNGLPMLKYQGYEQFKLFTGQNYIMTTAEDTKGINW